MRTLEVSITIAPSKCDHGLADAIEATLDPNGEYSTWVLPVADYDGGFVHTGAMHDKFKVKATPPQVCGNDTVEAGEQCVDGIPPTETAARPVA